MDAAHPDHHELDRIATEVAAAFDVLPGVVAVAMAGSRMAGAADPASDLDLYVYAAQPPPLSARQTIAASFATRFEVGNDVWEPGDEWIDERSGAGVDVIHRAPLWIEDQLDRVLGRHETSLGYSTCLWHNVLHSRPLVDREGWYRRLQAAADRPYPAELKRAIVARNHPLLRGSISSYSRQLRLAVDRGDAVGVQHRTTALLASYFDIIFAVNDLPHPGEKRLRWHATTRCPSLPVGFAHDLDALLAIPPTGAGDALLDCAGALLDRLDEWLAEHDLGGIGTGSDPAHAGLAGATTDSGFHRG